MASTPLAKRRRQSKLRNTTLKCEKRRPIALEAQLACSDNPIHSRPVPLQRSANDDSYHFKSAFIAGHLPRDGGGASDHFQPLPDRGGREERPRLVCQLERTERPVCLAKGSQ